MTPRRLASFSAVAALLALIGVVAPEIFSGTFSDLGTFLRAAALVGVLVAWVVAIRRLVPNRTIATAAAAVPVVAAVWLVLWPYLRPATEVDEAFPPAAVATTSITTTSSTTTTGPAASITDDSATTTSTTSTTSTTTVPPEPLELSRSGFQGLTGHRGNGDAAVYRLADESILLRFEEVDIGSGPDLDVYLVPGPDQRGLGGSHYVAPLTAERGNQNYAVPADVDLTSGTWTVLVWCETFDVEIANATLSL
jgi:hypothetical protein